MMCRVIHQAQFNLGQAIPASHCNTQSLLAVTGTETYDAECFVSVTGSLNWLTYYIHKQHSMCSQKSKVMTSTYKNKY